VETAVESQAEGAEVESQAEGAEVLSSAVTNRTFLSRPSCQENLRRSQLDTLTKIPLALVAWLTQLKHTKNRSRIT